MTGPVTVHRENGTVYVRTLGLPWTDERVGALIRLAEAGKSGSQIAAELGGVTRFSVIGKANKLGVKLRGKKSASATGRKRNVSSARTHEIQRARKASRSAMTGAYFGGENRPKPIREAPLPPTCQPVSLLERDERQCCWPIGEVRGPDTQFCGAPTTVGKMWCSYHVSRGYNSPNLGTRASAAATNHPTVSA